MVVAWCLLLQRSTSTPHLDFLGGGHGSAMLPAESREAQTVPGLARSVLEDACAAFDGGFHLEAFLTLQGPVFSEVGARIGGGSIPEEVEPSDGVNIVAKSILLSGASLPASPSGASARSRDSRNLSPESGMLAEAPKRFEHPDVVLSRSLHRADTPPMTHTNAEFAACGIPCSTRGVRAEHDPQVLHHIDATTRWSVSDHVALLEPDDYDAVVADARSFSVAS